jgi:hypothetical protein
LAMEIGVAPAKGSFSACPEMVSPAAATDARVFNEIGEGDRRPTR